MDLVDGYFKRFGFRDAAISEVPSEALSMVVVIPCHDEPRLMESLESLWACDRPLGAVEVIVVVNSAANSDPEVRDRNECTVREAGEWIGVHSEPGFRVHLLHHPDLPPRQAGVGLARKIGMDEALRRLARVGRLETGIVAGFDADCRCDPDYLCCLEAHFRDHPRTPGCSIRFEHPLSGPFDEAIYDAVARYELHLRYYIEAMRHAGVPHAFHTVGSAMAVRAGVYARQGGMNRRQAGEDFYFLHKVIPLGGYTELNQTRVIPSPRPSHRVPFGTGRAVSRHLAGGEPFRTYPLAAFRDLGGLFPRVDLFYAGAGPGTVSEAMRSFLEEQRFVEAVGEMRRNSGGLGSFRNRFYRWFDGFRVMKFIHHARDLYYGSAELAGESSALLDLLGGSRGGVEVRELLGCYRERGRRIWLPGEG